MKINNFTATEVLPALLSKSKTQTIRPAWHDKFVYVENGKSKEKPARFKSGEKVSLYWNQRSKYKIFCVSCGKGIKGTIKNQTFTCKCADDINFQQKISFYKNWYFPKTLGTATITEVFKIDMIPPLINLVRENNLLNNYYFDNEKIAKLDGFKSAQEMFSYFDKNYDLSEPKQFWCYRWEWD